MPKDLSKLISILFIKSVIIFQIIFTSMIFMINFGENIKRYSEYTGTNMFTYIYMTALDIPHIVLDITPFVFLFASLYAIRKISVSQELVIIKSFGISIWQFLAPLAKLTIIWSLIVIFGFSTLSSWCTSVYEKKRFNILHPENTSNIIINNDSTWIVDKINFNHQNIILVKKIVTNKKKDIILNDISLMEIRSGELLKILKAQKGRLVNKTLTLYNGTIKDNSSSLVNKFTSMKTSISLKQRQISSISAEPTQIMVWDMPYFIHNLKKININTSVHEIYFTNLITLPFLLLTMLLVSATFATDSARKGGGFVVVVKTIFTGFLIYILINIFNTIGDNGIIYPVLAVLIAKILALLASTTALIYKERL